MKHGASRSEADLKGDNISEFSKGSKRGLLRSFGEAGFRRRSGPRVLGLLLLEGSFLQRTTSFLKTAKEAEDSRGSIGSEQCTWMQAVMLDCEVAFAQSTEATLTKTLSLCLQCSCTCAEAGCSSVSQPAAVAA